MSINILIEFVKASPLDVVLMFTIYLEIFTVTFILQDEKFAKIRSRIKLNATFNNTSHILIMQKLNHANISDAKNFQRDKFPDIRYIFNSCTI